MKVRVAAGALAWEWNAACVTQMGSKYDFDSSARRYSLKGPFSSGFFEDVSA
jgi:hypothetical protein